MSDGRLDVMGVDVKQLKVLFLGRSEIESLLDMKTVIPEIHRVFECHGKKTVLVPDPPKTMLALEPSINGHWVAMPAYVDLGRTSVGGVKWISTFPDNPKKHGLSTSSAMVIINDPATGFPLCFMEAALLTAYRTGAAAAVGTSYLARKNSCIVGIIGASFQGRFQLQALAETLNLDGCRVFDIDKVAAQTYKAEMEERLPGIDIKICGSLKESISGSDIVVTATTASCPFFEGDWLEEGMLLIAIGGRPELKWEVIDRAEKIVVDTINGCMHQGALARYFESGQLKRGDVYSELGEIVVCEKRGRENEKETILYVPIGVGTEDVVVARKLYELAKKRGKGVELSLF